MDCNGKTICDSLNADLRVIEEYDTEDGAWRDIGTRDYFDFFANAKEDVEWLIAEIHEWKARAESAEYAIRERAEEDARGPVL
jgi:hypothetical protein